MPKGRTQTVGLAAAVISLIAAAIGAGASLWARRSTSVVRAAIVVSNAGVPCPGIIVVHRDQTRQTDALGRFVFYDDWVGHSVMLYSTTRGRYRPHSEVLHDAAIIRFDCDAPARNARANRESR